MKLDRDLNADGSGKYALVNLRELRRIGGAEKNPDIAHSLRLLELSGLLEWGQVGTEGEFFVVKLRDKYAGDALRGYSDAVQRDAQKETDEAAMKDKYQWAIAVQKLASRAGDLSPFCKQPD